MFNYCPPKDLGELKSITMPDGKRVYETPDGNKYPSITTIIGAKNFESIQQWRDKVGHEEANKISRNASGRGKNMHSLCEDYLNNIELRDTMPDALVMFKSIKPFLNNINNIHYQEQTLWSHQLKIAGRVDCIGEYNGKLSVIDFKTSRKPKKLEHIEDYFIQTCAYSLMYEELIGTPIDNLVIIMAVENSEPLIFEQNASDYVMPLVDTIKFFRSRK
jgi:genome maintenance exonuclease 1